MKRLDPRSVIIGFLIAVIGFMSMGATNNTFDSITVNEILVGDKVLEINYADGDFAGRTLATISLVGVELSSQVGNATLSSRGLILENQQDTLRVRAFGISSSPN